MEPRDTAPDSWEQEDDEAVMERQLRPGSNTLNVNAKPFVPNVNAAEFVPVSLKTDSGELESVGEWIAALLASS